MKFQDSPIKTNDLSKNVYLFILYCSQVLGNLVVKHSIETGECGFKYLVVGSQTPEKHYGMLKNVSATVSLDGHFTRN